MRRNIVFLGSVGSGKSTTCNTIYHTDLDKSDPFEVAHDESHSTTTIFKKKCKPKNLTLIDTPGFGNNQLSEKKVNETLSQLSSVFTEPNSKIDAFILVLRLTPRAQTLKIDLERIRTVFGRAGLKSTILLLIYSSKKGSTGDFLEKLEQMEEAEKLLKEGKQEEPNEDWYCLWDNINPREGQEEELLRKIEKITPYTQNDFHKGQHDLNFYHEERFKEEMVSKKVKGVKKEDSDEKSVAEITEADLEESMKKIMEIMDMRQISYKFRIDDVLKKNAEMFEKFMKRVEELESKDKEEIKRKETFKLISDLICRKRKFGQEERTELVGTTLTEGAEKTAETSARSIGGKIGQKVGQLGGKGIHKGGGKLIKEILSG